MPIKPEGPALFASLPLSRLPRRARLAVLVIVPLVVAAALYVGAAMPPDTTGPSSAEAASEIAGRFHIPADADETLIGDFLVERFYIYDTETGQRKVADIVKGRIQNVIVSMTGDWSGYDYRFALNRQGLEAERDRLKAFVATLAPPDPNLNAEYLGLWVQGGATGVFLFNYTGRLPEEHSSFSSPSGEGDIYEFLRLQDYAETSKRIRVLDVNGTSFLLRTAADAPYYRENFRTQKAILLAELLVLDGTSPAQTGTLREISWHIPLR